MRRPRRAVVQITDRGKEVLAQHPDRIDLGILAQFEEFIDFQNRSRAATTADHPRAADAGGAARPRETIATAVAEANSAVAVEVLNRVREREPVFLEQVVLKVLLALGYGGQAGTAEHLGRSGDEGLDGVIRQDPLGLDRVYVQAKRHATARTVGRPELQEFVGACTEHKLAEASSSQRVTSPLKRLSMPIASPRGSS